MNINICIGVGTDIGTDMTPYNICRPKSEARERTSVKKSDGVCVYERSSSVTSGVIA